MLIEKMTFSCQECMFLGGVCLTISSVTSAFVEIVCILSKSIYCISGPIASIVTMIFSCRVCMFIGGVCLTISCVTSAFVESVNVLILTYGIIGGR